MPTTLHVDPIRGCVYVSATGRFTNETYAATIQAILNHPDRKPEFAEVWDGLRLRHFAFTPAILDVYRQFMVAYQNAGLLTQGRIAVLARQEEIRTMAVLLDKISSKYVQREIRLFVRAADAEAWLGLAPDTFADITRENTGHVVALSDPAEPGDAVRRAG
ncbi:MAG: hypothetical protein AAGJ10_01645 [Bacteroidota bacterium]